MQDQSCKLESFSEKPRLRLAVGVFFMICHVIQALDLYPRLCPVSARPQADALSTLSSVLYLLLSRAAVAQLDRVLGYEPRGRGFDSCQPHQN